MSGIFLDATLTRVTIASPSPDAPFDPVATTTTTYTCKAIHEEFSLRDRADGTIEQRDRKVIILAGSLSVTPITDDSITIRGERFKIMDVTSDPALATWTCRARK